MNKVKVKLNETLKKKCLGFSDVEGKQEIRPKKSEDVITVNQTNFVKQKIQSGELIVVSVEETKEEKPKEEKK